MDADHLDLSSCGVGTLYFQWSLQCGFIIPQSAYPGWWIWVYYLNPVRHRSLP